MTAQSPISTDEKRQALQQVLESRTFLRSEQLRTLLRFICETDLEGRHERLTEYVIGVEVLHRPEGYSPAEDSAVRTRAYELRHKLEKLYAEELSAALVRIVLPKGAYIPQFVRAEQGAQAEETRRQGEREAGASAAGWWPRFGLAMCLISAAAAAAACYLLLRVVAPAPARVDPIIAEAWGPLAKPTANVLLCVATPLDLIVGPATHEAYGSPAYPAPPEAYGLFSQHRPLAPGAKLGLLFTDNMLGFGTMNGVLAVVNELRSLGAGYQVLPERVAPVAALRNRNAALFGAPVDSNAVTTVLEKTPLTVDYEPSVREFVVRDRQSGQSIVPEKDANGDFVDVYGLLTVATNRQGEGEQLRTLVFSGITSTGTHGAAEYFASPNALRDLKARFAREGVQGFPSHYQVVVRCRFANLLLLHYEYYTHRVIEK